MVLATAPPATRSRARAGRPRPAIVGRRDPGRRRAVRRRVDPGGRVTPRPRFGLTRGRVDSGDPARRFGAGQHPHLVRWGLLVPKDQPERAGPFGTSPIPFEGTDRHLHELGVAWGDVDDGGTELETEQHLRVASRQPGPIAAVRTIVDGQLGAARDPASRHPGHQLEGDVAKGRDVDRRLLHHASDRVLGGRHPDSQRGGAGVHGVLAGWGEDDVDGSRRLREQRQRRRAERDPRCRLAQGFEAVAVHDGSVVTDRDGQGGAATGLHLNRGLRQLRLGTHGSSAGRFESARFAQ